MVEISELKSKEQTGAAMSELVRYFSSDIRRFGVGETALSDFPLDRFFAFVRALPYQQDTAPVEVIARPAHLLSQPWLGWDCKKKAILIASWLNENHIPWRFVAVSTRPDGQIHHCITQGMIADEWRTIDATYPENELWSDTTYTTAETISGETKGRAAYLVCMSGDGSPADTIEMIRYRAQVLRDPAVMSGDPITLGAGAIVAIVSAIVAAVGGITAAIIGAVSAKRREERALTQQIAVARQQERIQEAEQSQTTETREKIVTAMKTWGIPSAIAAGLFFLG